MEQEASSSKTKKIIVHRFSLGGGNLVFELSGNATVGEIRKKVFEEARARDEKKYRVDFGCKRVRLFLSHFELVEDNIDLLLETEEREQDHVKGGKVVPSSDAFEYKSRYHAGKELQDAMTVYDLCDFLQEDAADKSTLGSPARSSSTRGGASPVSRRARSPHLRGRKSHPLDGFTPRGKLSPRRVASQYESPSSPRNPNLRLNLRQAAAQADRADPTAGIGRISGASEQPGAGGGSSSRILQSGASAINMKNDDPPVPDQNTTSAGSKQMICTGVLSGPGRSPMPSSRPRPRSPMSAVGRSRGGIFSPAPSGRPSGGGSPMHSGRGGSSPGGHGSAFQSRSRSPLGFIREIDLKAIDLTGDTPMQTGRDPVLPSYIRKEKMSALLAHEDMPLSAAMLRIPYAHRHLIVQDDELQAADLEGPPEPSPRPSSSNPDEAEVEALVQASARKSARFHSDSVSDAGKTGGQDRRSRSPAPSENKKKFKQRRRIDEVHISAYVSVDWPQCMREPDHIWKRRQRMVTQLGRTATGTISNAKLFETLMKVDGFKRPFRSASSGALLDIRSSSSSGAGQLTIKPPQMATFGGNLYLDMTQEGNLAVELFRTRRAANKTDIRENTTLGRTLFSAHSGASRIVNMSRSVNPAVMTKRPKTPLNR